MEVSFTRERMPESRIRPLFVDTRLKEYTTGMPHEVTDHLFVVQRMFRLNDSLPDEAGGAPRWPWQRGGWVLVDRVTGRMAPITLPEFDPLLQRQAGIGITSRTAEFQTMGRDCLRWSLNSAAARQFSRSRWAKPETILRPIQHALLPGWQRQPARVTFEPVNGPKVTFAVRGHAVDVVVDDEEQEAASK